MSKRDERALLQELARALSPGLLEPPAELVQRVRERAEVGLPLVNLERRRRRLQRMFVATAIVVCVLSFVAGAVLSPNLPNPVRAALESVGLTVESP